MIANNTTNVSAAFKILIDEVEAEIELINKIGLRAWEKRDYHKANEAGEHATLVTAYRDRIISLSNDWQTLVERWEGKIEEKIMLSQAHNYESEEVTGTRPTTVSILGQSFTVRFWRDVFECVMNTIANLRPEKFEQLMVRLPHIAGRDEKKFTKARKLKNGIFIEVNLSAHDIVQNCSKILKMAELSVKDSVVVTAQRKIDGMALRITILPGSIKIQ